VESDIYYKLVLPSYALLNNQRLGVRVLWSGFSLYDLGFRRHRNQRKFDELLAKQTTLRDNYNKV